MKKTPPLFMYDGNFFYLEGPAGLERREHIARHARRGEAEGIHAREGRGGGNDAG